LLCCKRSHTKLQSNTAATNDDDAAPIVVNKRVLHLTIEIAVSVTAAACSDLVGLPHHLLLLLLLLTSC